MAYDRKMGVARFYTRAEFSERVDDAVAAAELHNRRARNLRKISSLENDTAALRQIYQNYFQHPDDAGRVRSLTNDAIIEDDHSPAVASAIVAFKEAALQNERDLDELDLEHATKRQEQAAKTEGAQFELEDIDQALAMLASERTNKQTLLDDVLARLAAEATDTANADTIKPAGRRQGRTNSKMRPSPASPMCPMPMSCAAALSATQI